MGRYLVLMLVLGVAALSGCGSGDVQTGVQEGMRLPDAEFTRLEGGTLNLSDLRGRPTVINFWATWCGPCKEEIPLLQQAYTSQGQSFELIAVTEESERDVSSFVTASDMRLPVVLDPGGRASQRYHIQGIPTTFFLDSHGVIIIRHIGALTPGTLQVFLEQITGGGSVPASPPAQPAPTDAPTQPARTPAPLPTPGSDLLGRRWP